METSPKPATADRMTRGQAVVIRIVNASGATLDEYSGVFLGYWRNGRYWVREDKFGTASTYYAHEIHQASKEAA